MLQAVQLNRFEGRMSHALTRLSGGSTNNLLGQRDIKVERDPFDNARLFEHALAWSYGAS